MMGSWGNYILEPWQRTAATALLLKEKMSVFD